MRHRQYSMATHSGTGRDDADARQQICGLQWPFRILLEVS
jgi:hypothetical protein